MSSEGSKQGGRRRARGREDGACAPAPAQPTPPATALGQRAPANTSLNVVPPILARGYGRGTGAQAPIQPTPPARALGQAPSNSSGAFQYNGFSASLNQFRPITAPVPPNPKKSYAAATKAGLTVQLGAARGVRATIVTKPIASPDAGQVRSSSSAATVKLPIPEAAGHYKDNATIIEGLRRGFYKYLDDNKDHYKKQINETTRPCQLLVSFEDMVRFNAVSSTIRATCSYVKQNSLGDWLIPAAEDFLRDCVNEHIGSNKPCISFSGFPESIQNADEYGPLVQRVSVLGGEHSITTLTENGNKFIQILIVGILENHKKGISWGGSYGQNDIHIIKWPSSPSHLLNKEKYSYEMKILLKPVEVNGRSLELAMVGDQRKAAEIFRSLYNDLPVYFLELIEQLHGTEQVLFREAWFIKYFSHHPAIMPSSDRISLLTNKLHPARLNISMVDIMPQTPDVYPYDWTTNVVNKPLLNDVFTHNGNSYGNTAGELIRFFALLSPSLRRRCVPFFCF